MKLYEEILLRTIELEEEFGSMRKVPNDNKKLIDLQNLIEVKRNGIKFVTTTQNEKEYFVNESIKGMLEGISKADIARRIEMDYPSFLKRYKEYKVQVLLDDFKTSLVS